VATCADVVRVVGASVSHFASTTCVAVLTTDSFVVCDAITSRDNGDGMSTTAVTPLLNAAQACLDFAGFASDIRRVVREHASEYEECLDVSLSQQLELVSGLMDAYVCLCPRIADEYFELGDEPRSHGDAVQGLGDFAAAASGAVKRALNDPGYLFPAQYVGVRAMTFACVLRST
jgi:hypothetical protein